MNKTILFGHLAAIFSILIWGVTFISTKLLLFSLTPLEILFYRFLLGWFALWILCPKWLPIKSFRQEGLYAVAGLCGITLYFLLENIALQWTLASNVSVLVSIAPFFTGLAAWIIIGDTRPKINFYIGFIIALAGICLISFSGNDLQVNPLGDSFALMAAIAWAFYSIFTKKIALYGDGSLLSTRRIFFYGLILMAPCFLIEPLQADIFELLRPVNWGNLLFLGLGASALCFACWTYSLVAIGTATASAYIYLVPVITVISASLVLNEQLSGLAICGCLLTLIGLLTSEMRFLEIIKNIFMCKIFNKYGVGKN